MQKERLISMKKTALHLLLAFAALIALCLASFSGVTGTGLLSLSVGAAILGAAAYTAVSMEQLVHTGACI